ncbi:MAG: homogentisate 1,2-dioxygenase [Burkholderiaceae bacterium]
MTGFGGHFATEAISGALPIGRNSPQKAPLGLYPEQLSGSAFTAPRAANRRSWFYRILPSVKHTANGFRPVPTGLIRTAPCRDENQQPFSQMRWNPIEMPSKPTSFVQGITTIVTAGDAQMGAGMASHVYAANRSMVDEYFFNADGEMLLVPQSNRISVATECGRLDVGPGEIIVIPRGMKFQVNLPDGEARGYICENYGASFVLPERGPIGANCLANERDFLVPVAAYEDTDKPVQLYAKSLGKMYLTDLNHSPLDVVAWHGNLAPYKYDLARFSTIGSIAYDHPDPSIFTVLTSPSDTVGTANVDFVIFAERWLVMEDTFRPPWYHSNVMSEFMGMVHGVYDAKPGGFSPGAMSLHNMMIPHGPDRDAFEHASNVELSPQKLTNTLAFMFETRYPLNPTAFGSEPAGLDINYADCWASLERRFTKP